MLNTIFFGWWRLEDVCVCGGGGGAGGVGILIPTRL